MLSRKRKNNKATLVCILFFSSFFITSNVFISSLNSTNNYLLENKHFYKSNSYNYQFIYDDNFNNNFFVNFNNEFKNIDFNFSNQKIIINDDVNSIKKIFEKYIDFEYSKEFLTADYVLDNNNNIQISFKNELYEYPIKVSCNKKHNKIQLICDNINHQGVHNNRCWKTVWYDCPKCLDSYKSLTINKEFNFDNFNLFIKNSWLNSNKFDLSNLIKIDWNNSYKTIYKNILTFKFNTNFIKAVILNSFNKAYAEYFIKTDWMFNQNRKNAIYNALIQNKLTLFDSKVNNFFNTSSFNDQKQNIRYWMENEKQYTDDEFINQLNNLDFLDFCEYLNEQSFDINDIFLGKILFTLISDENYSKNVIFNIDYKIDTNQLKNIQISLFDLINNQNNKIIYNFDTNPNSIHFNKQAISIVNMSILQKNINDFLDLKEHAIGIDFNNKFIKPVINDENTHIIFNPEIKYDKLFTVVNQEINESKKFLIKNNVIGLPSDNLNEYASKVFTNLSFFINYIDNDSDEWSIDNNVLKYKKIIKDIILNENDSLGRMYLKIIFVDDTYVDYFVDGLDKVELKIIKNEKELNIKDFEQIEINNQNVLTKLFNFKNKKQNQNYLAYINCTYNDFIKNHLNKFSISENINNYEITLETKDETNKKLSFYINKSVNKNFQQLISNDGLLIIILSVVSIIITILVSILAYKLIKKYKK